LIFVCQLVNLQVVPQSQKVKRERNTKKAIFQSCNLTPQIEQGQDDKNGHPLIVERQLLANQHSTFYGNVR